jgi:hypothetical protein
VNELEFIEKIDCRFPYHAPIEWRRLSARAARISPNAAFMVFHEICRAPARTKVSKAQASKILEHLSRRFRHPLVRVISPAVQALVSGKSLSEASALALMRKVAKYPNQFNALSLCYFSAIDGSGRADLEYNRIVKKWSQI